MESIGRTVILEEKDFSSFIGLAGSSPALVCAFIDALARAGVMGGIPKALAVQIVAQAVLGTARTVQTEAQRTAEGGNGRTPADLIDAVCSPGGTSVAGMVALERAGFSDASCAPSRPSPSATGSWAPELRRDPTPLPHATTGTACAARPFSAS